MKKKLGFIISIVILAVVLFLASQYIDLGKAMDVLSRADILLLFAAIVLETVSMGLKTLKWKLFTDELNPAISFGELFQVQCFGIALSNLTPARLGEASKALYLEKHGIKKRLTLLTILWDHLLDIIAIVAFSTLIATSYGTITAAFLAATLVLIVIAYNSDSIVKRLAGFKQLTFLSEFTLHKFRKITLLKAMLVTFASWGVELLAVSLAFHAVGATLPFTTIIGAYAISMIIGLLSTIPGGLGSLDATLFLLLKDAATAPVLAAAVIAARLVTIIWIYILGGISAITMHKK